MATDREVLPTGLLRNDELHRGFSFVGIPGYCLHRLGRTARSGTERGILERDYRVTV